MKRFNPCIAPATAPTSVAETPSSAVIFSPPPCPDGGPDAVSARAAAREAQEELSKRRHAEFIAFMGQPGAPKVEIKPGMMAVVLSVKFDNSDTMTDYFDRHASLSDDFVVLVVKKQGETERLARKALALLPDLASFEWKWCTEKWSMGHGNYLTSKGFELPIQLQNLETGYRSGGVTHGHWEIEFIHAYREQTRFILPHRNFGKEQSPAAAATPAGKPTSIQFTVNEAKGGLELRFPTVPSEAVRNELKAARWRWSRFGGCWYVKASPESRTWADAFIARHSEATTPAPVAPAEPVAATQLPPVDPVTIESSVTLVIPVEQTPPVPESIPVVVTPPASVAPIVAATQLPSWRQRAFKR